MRASRFRSLLALLVQGRARRGFNLVESAIILGIVGLVIGGIWIAAAQVTTAQKINETAAGIYILANNMRAALPQQAYPTTASTSIDVGNVARTGNLWPPGFIPHPTNNTFAVNPAGVVLGIHMSCYGTYLSTNCPMIAVRMIGPAGTPRSQLQGSECVQILRRFAALSRDRSDLIYAQISIPGNSSYQFLFPPIDGNTVDCPSNFDYVVFWFKP